MRRKEKIQMRQDIEAAKARLSFKDRQAVHDFLGFTGTFNLFAEGVYELPFAQTTKVLRQSDVPQYGFVWRVL